MSRFSKLIPTHSAGVTAVDNDRSAVINIGGVEHRMVLTTRATKAIAVRHGGLEDLSQKLMQSEHFEEALDEIVWLLTLLCNQSILIYNLRHKNAPKELLTEDEVELLTSPLELAGYKEAITEAMFKGTARDILSEGEGGDGKNTQGGQAMEKSLPA